MTDDFITPDGLVAGNASVYNHLLLFLAAHPAPQPFVAFYEKFVFRLTNKFKSLDLLKHVYIYTPQQLHITVATLHLSKRPSVDLYTCASVWTSVLNTDFGQDGRKDFGSANGVDDKGKDGDGSESEYPHLQLSGASMDTGVGVLLWDDPSAVFTRWRDRIRDTIRRPEVVSTLAEAGSDATASRLPNIVHSTVLRWRSTPKMHAHELRSLFVDTFHEVLHLQDNGVTIHIDSLRIVEEEARCMEQSRTHCVFPV